jgi:tetratricopeptide (TPR) repeat protein
MAVEQNHSRLARCQKIREAEGLLELATIPAIRLGLRADLRKKLARRALRLVARLATEPDEAWQRDLVIGQSLRLQGKYRQAIGPLFATVRRNPEQRAGWMALAWCLRRSGHLDRAAGVMGKAIAEIPDDPYLHFNFACYLALLGQPDLAISELLWALDLNPELRRRIAKEADFDKIRNHAAFQAIISRA